MSFPANFSNKNVQKIKVLSLCLYFSEKFHDLIRPCNGPKFNLHHLKNISSRFKMVAPKLGMGILLHDKVLLTKYFRSSYY